MSRHFIHVGGRRVHYRRWGEGPVVLVLHGSPQSSRAVEGLGGALVANGLCVIAPDTPGNGLSSPLAGNPTSVDYAQALVEFADALGLRRFGLTGYHTGAATACTLAALHPDRVTAIFFNGLSCWTDEERASVFESYMPPFVPAWDGSHMAWVWARLEEQMIFFPWNEATPETRMMNYVLPPLAAMQKNALDFLESGDGYRAPYASAFGFRTEAWFHRIKAPYLLAATKTDPLRTHLDRPPLRDAPFRIFDDAASLWSAAAAVLSAHSGDAAPPPPPSGTDAEGLSRGITKGIAWRGRLDGAGRPLLLLHEAGGSSRTFDPILAKLAAARPVVAIDLPGHGASADGWTEPLGSLEAIAQTVGGALQVLAIDRPAVAGRRFGGMIAAEMLVEGRSLASASFGPLIGRAGELIDHAAPSLGPEWDGAHLVRAFRIARWERLFDPWYRRNQRHAIPQGNLDPEDVQARAVDLIRAGCHWTEAVAAEIGFEPGAVASMTVLPADLVEAGKPLAQFSV